MSFRKFVIASALSSCILASAAGSVQADGRVQIASSPRDLADFELTDQDGKAFRFSQLRGDAALVFFGFTHCPDICPATMVSLKQLDRSLRGSGIASPQVVMISVDGERDSPSVMKAYLEPLSKEFIGLTGDPKAVRKVASGFAAVFFKGLPGDASGRYLVEHTSQVFLVDSDGRLRATFFEASVERMTETIRQLAATVDRQADD